MPLRVIDGVEVGVERRTIAMMVGRRLCAAARIFPAYELLLDSWFGWGRSRLVSDFSPGLHLTYGVPCFRTLPPGGDWLFG